MMKNDAKEVVVLSIIDYNGLVIYQKEVTMVVNLVEFKLIVLVTYLRLSDVQYRQRTSVRSVKTSLVKFLFVISR